MTRQAIFGSAAYLGLAVAWATTALGPPLVAGRVIEQVAVVVDGEPYTHTDIKNFARDKMRRDYANKESADVDQATKVILEQFITEKLVGAEVKRSGIKISDEQIDQYVERVKKRTGLSGAQLIEALKREGMAMQQYRASIRSELEKGELINREVEKRVNITPEDIERYYEANPLRFMTSARVRLRHILIQVSEDAKPAEEKAAVSRALKIRSQAVSGADFSQLAREYSEGAGAFNGGDIGWVDRSSLLDEIAKVAFDMSPEEISEPVRTSLGVHLIKLEDRQRAEVLPLSRVRKKIKEELYTKALEERFQKWIKTDLRRKHRVDVKIPGFVFRAEETKEGTVSSLMASAPREEDNERRGFLSYLNPLTYFTSTTPLEDEEGELRNENVVSVFGLPLFVTESADDLSDPSLLETEGSEPADAPAEKSEGFFSSVLDTLNPF